VKCEHDFQRFFIQRLQTFFLFLSRFTFLTFLILISTFFLHLWLGVPYLFVVFGYSTLLFTVNSHFDIEIKTLDKNRPNKIK